MAKLNSALKLFAVLIFLIAASIAIMAPSGQDSGIDVAEDDEVIRIDLAGRKEFTVGNFDASIMAFDDYIRVNLVDRNGSNFIVYHFSNPPPSEKMSFADYLGNTKTVSLTDLPQAKEREPDPGYHSYRGRIEAVLTNAQFLEKEGYDRDSIPVIVTMDLSANLDSGYARLSGNPDAGKLSRRMRQEAFNSTKEQLLGRLTGSRGLMGTIRGALGRSRSISTMDLEIIDAVAMRVSERQLDLLDSSIVERVSLDKKVQVYLPDSVGIINASKVWRLHDSLGRNITGRNRTIAIIDTGMDYTHPDLGGCLGTGCRVLGGYDFVNTDADPMDDHGHGTHCAGIAAGNGTTVKGVAPDAKLYAYKVLGSSGSGSYSNVIAGIQRATDPDDDGDSDDRVDVISMSLGGSGHPDDEVSRAVDTAVGKGVVVVVAAGNSGPYDESIGSPGVARKALTIGASCKPSQIGVHGYCNEKIARFSSRGPTSIGGIKPDVVAPGVEICAAQWEDAWQAYQCVDNDHTAISGTSMATPHVAGAAALLLQANNWKPLQVKSALMLTALDLGFAPNTQGTGQIDIYRAKNATFATSPQSISLGYVSTGVHSVRINITSLRPAGQNLTLNVTNVTDETGYSYNLSYLNATALLVPGNGTASFTFNITVPSLLDGSFEGRVTLRGINGLHSIPFTFIHLANLTVTVLGPQPLYPDLLLHNEDFSVKRGLFQGDILEGNTYTFMIPSGNYTVYAVGDSEDLSMEYILMDTVEVLVDHNSSLTLSTYDAREYTVNARSFDGTGLKLYDWEKAFFAYRGEELLSYAFIDPGYGDRTVYVSNKPDNKATVDIVFRYYGIPSDTPFEGGGWSKMIMGEP
ncbi:MAG: S8 family serine peptidase [archaeon]